MFKRAYVLDFTPLERTKPLYTVVVFPSEYASSSDAFLGVLWPVEPLQATSLR
jgi:hypothetical protein